MTDWSSGLLEEILDHLGAILDDGDDEESTAREMATLLWVTMTTR